MCLNYQLENGAQQEYRICPVQQPIDSCVEGQDPQVIGVYAFPWWSR